MANKLLIVVDMQNDFVTGSLGSKAAQSIVPVVKEKIKEYRSAGHTIIVTKDTHFDDYPETEEGKHLPAEHCIMNSWGAEIVDELHDVLQPYSEEYKDSNVITLNKFTFGCDRLISLLQGREAAFKEVELIGLCTDICVIANAVVAKTALPDAHIIVDASCCAGTSEENHKNALKVMEVLQIEIRNS